MTYKKKTEPEPEQPVIKKRQKLTTGQMDFIPFFTAGNAGFNRMADQPKNRLSYFETAVKQKKNLAESRWQAYQWSRTKQNNIGKKDLPDPAA